MGAHFRAFSFVDRITSIHDGQRIHGLYRVPSRPVEFPLSLVGEAIGQLAAWAAMAAVNFEQRPVAGLAGSIEFFLAPRAGQVLELAAEIVQVDNDSVQYHGTAHWDNTLVIRLQDCVGPMVPLADFDDPAVVQNRFKVLCRRGADSGSFPELPPLKPERTGGEPGRTISASFTVPTTAPLFTDHFPRRPVFPGSLLMHLNLELGAALAGEITPPPSGSWVPGTVVGMKLRTFIPPGSHLRLEATLKHLSPPSASLALKTSMENEVIASAGLMLKEMEVP